MATIRWLHLTDLHFGMKGQNWLWPSIKTAFFDDLKRVRAKVGGPWDIVLFTGDLTQTGSPAQFSGLTKVLEELWTYLDPDTQLLAVPGNHDLVRPPPKGAVVKALGQWFQDPDVPDEFWHSTDNEYRTTIASAFKPFIEWRESCPFHARVSTANSEISGDFSYTFEKDGVKLGIVGLDSAFLQLTDGEYEAKLALEPRQLQSVCGGDAATWLGKHHLSLLLTHHPVDWLHPRSRDAFYGEILGRDNFVAHFHGHLHVPAGKFRREGGGPTRRTLQGASLFGLESFGKQNDKKRIHGYSAGTITISGDSISLRVWPRIATVVQGNYQKLVPDSSFDLDSSDSYADNLSRAFAGGATPALDRQPALPTTANAALGRIIDAFRQRLSGSFERWDLQSIGVAQPGGTHQPIAPRLDDMYVPLRFAENYNPNVTDRGEAIAATELLKLEHAVVVRGPAGAGKTTWSRVLFRELLRRPDAIPLMVVLRDLARRWSHPECHNEARSLDAHLEGIIREHVPEADRNTLHDLLVDSSAPRPVLLVDGWDEVGPLADELRVKLSGLLSQYPRVLAVVTSRPYGQGQPSSSDSFRLLDIQPLSNDDVASLAMRFFKFCYGEDLEPVADRVERFIRAVERAPEPLRLARTPLLLTMMLFISRSGPLPDKRHRLYQACIDNLLTALPGQKEDEGALHPRRHWRPADAEDRMRVVAALAYSVQQKSREGSDAESSIIATMGELAGWMSDDWPQESQPGMSRAAQRAGFIHWLAGPAGILTERADGTFVFTHLSFQEYLTAWHLNATVEGSGRIDVFKKRCGDSRWIEVLRLFGAIIGAQSEDRIKGVVDALRRGPADELFLAGMLYADGVPSQGSGDGFPEWLSAFVPRIAGLPPARYAAAIVEAWNASQQHERKSALVDAFMEISGSLNLGSWAYFSQTVDRLIHVPFPKPSGARRVASWTRGDEVQTAEDVAFGRVLSGLWTTWPGKGELSLLQAWPTARKLAGMRAQIAALCGASRADIVLYANELLAPFKWTRENRQRAVETARSLPKEWLRLSDGEFNSTSYRRALLSALLWAYAHEPPLGRFFMTIEGKGIVTIGFAIELQNNIQRRVRSMMNLVVSMSVTSSRPLLSILGRWGGWFGGTSDENRDTVKTPQWYIDSRALDATATSVYMARHAIATRTAEGSLETMMKAACKLSLEPRGKGLRLALDRALRDSADGTMWGALARHIGRVGSTHDMRMLEEAAEYPEKYSKPLQWGLRYMIRGDIMFEDGTGATLDDISDEAGLARLPLVETMPDEASAVPRTSHPRKQA